MITTIVIIISVCLLLTCLWLHRSRSHQVGFLTDRIASLNGEIASLKDQIQESANLYSETFNTLTAENVKTLNELKDERNKFDELKFRYDYMCKMWQPLRENCDTLRNHIIATAVEQSLEKWYAISPDDKDKIWFRVQTSFEKSQTLITLGMGEKEEQIAFDEDFWEKFVSTIQSLLRGN